MKRVGHPLTSGFLRIQDFQDQVTYLQVENLVPQTQLRHFVTEAQTLPEQLAQLLRPGEAACCQIIDDMQAASKQLYYMREQTSHRWNRPLQCHCLIS